MTELLHHCAAQGHQLQVLISSIQQTLVNHLGKEENCNNQQAFSLFIIFCGNPNRIFQLNHIVLHSYQSVQCVCVHACVCAHLLHNYAWTLVDIYILIFSITFFISMYIMCVCLFSALNRRAGALQISIIIIMGKNIHKTSELVGEDMVWCVCVCSMYVLLLIALLGTILCSRADSLRSCRMWF